MRQVLIIAHLDPTYGSNRIIPLVEHLPEFGWQPVILTPSLQEKPGLPARVIETPYHGILALALLRKLFKPNPNESMATSVRTRFGIRGKSPLIDFARRLVREVFAYPDLCTEWKPFAIKIGNELLENESIDAILSCMPVTSYVIAGELKTKHEIPWVVDLTDLWSQNHHYPYGCLRRWFETRLEQKTLSRADALVTISQPWAEKLKTLHQGQAVHVIHHGFDPAEVNNAPDDLTDKLTLTYTGRIYIGKQDPAKLFQALQGLISDGTIEPNEIEIRFYGTKEIWLEKQAERYGLSTIVKQYGRVPKQVSLQKQRESQLLLLLDWDDPWERGVYTSKIFEYLGARRPILATGGSKEGVVAELLNETQAGRHASNVADIKDALKELYQEYKLKGGVAYRGVESEVNKYSHREMARKFSEVLNHITSEVSAR